MEFKEGIKVLISSVKALFYGTLCNI